MGVAWVSEPLSEGATKQGQDGEMREEWTFMVLNTESPPFRVTAA